jgi:hypothetical protein
MHSIDLEFSRNLINSYVFKNESVIMLCKEKRRNEIEEWSNSSSLEENAHINLRKPPRTQEELMVVIGNQRTP